MDLDALGHPVMGQGELGMLSANRAPQSADLSRKHGIEIVSSVAGSVKEAFLDRVAYFSMDSASPRGSR